jgi:hypothetical protein
MKNTIITFIAIAPLILASCKKEESANTAWGEKIKEELEILFDGIEDLAYCKVYDCAGDTLYWSGFDAGNPEEDSRQIEYSFMETELVLIYKRYLVEEGHWTNSMIQVKYNDVATYVLQYATFVGATGGVYRKANKVLIFMKDDADPPVLNGSEGNASW